MQAIKGKGVKGITIGTRLHCDDNSGAKVLKVIGVKGWRGVLRRNPRAGLADVVIASVVKGTPQMRKKVVKAVVIRQKAPFRRRNGTRIMFEDNAAIVINDDGTPKGSEIKGAVAREVIERFSNIGNIASIVV